MDHFALISLQGVMEPPPVGWWPLAWGWQLVLLTLALLFLAGLALWMRRWPWALWRFQMGLSVLMWRLQREDWDRQQLNGFFDRYQRLVKGYARPPVWLSGPGLHVWMGEVLTGESSHLHQTEWARFVEVFAQRYQAQGVDKTALLSLLQHSKTWAKSHERRSQGDDACLG